MNPILLNLPSIVLLTSLSIILRYILNFIIKVVFCFVFLGGGEIFFLLWIKMANKVFSLTRFIMLIKPLNESLFKITDILVTCKIDLVESIFILSGTPRWIGYKGLLMDIVMQLLPKITPRSPLSDMCKHKQNPI